MNRSALTRRVGVLALVPALLSLTACGQGPVRAVPFTESDSEECQRVAQQWPFQLVGMDERVTAVQSDGVAAWGDPAVVARCGKMPPGPTTDVCIDVNGIDWVGVELDDGGTMFTTYGRDPAIEVLVPAEYESHVMMLPGLTPAAREIEQTLGECTSTAG